MSQECQKQTTGFRQVAIEQVAIEYVWYRTAPGRHHRPDLEGQGHEILVKPFCTLSYCDLVHLVAVQLERYRSVADRNRLRRSASQHHGRRAEAGGKAESSGGNATRVRSGGTPSGPAIATHTNGDWDVVGWDGVGRDFVGCAGSHHGEACPARERGQQLQRWLRIKLQTRQGPLGWMQRIGGLLLSFLSNLQRHTHPQGLRAMRRNQNVPGLGAKPILVVLHRHAEWGEISAHRRESKQIAHAYRGSIANS